MASLGALPAAEFCAIDDATLILLTTLLTLAKSTSDPPEILITSGTDGQHSGPDDPHHRGHALDIRTHNFPTRRAKFEFAEALQRALGQDFFVFVEDPDEPNEHIHAQVRKGVTWPKPTVRVPVPRNV